MIATINSDFLFGFQAGFAVSGLLILVVTFTLFYFAKK